MFDVFRFSPWKKNCTNTGVCRTSFKMRDVNTSGLIFSDPRLLICFWGRSKTTVLKSLTVQMFFDLLNEMFFAVLCDCMWWMHCLWMPCFLICPDVVMDLTIVKRSKHHHVVWTETPMSDLITAIWQPFSSYWYSGWLWWYKDFPEHTLTIELGWCYVNSCQVPF